VREQRRALVDESPEYHLSIDCSLRAGTSKAGIIIVGMSANSELAGMMPKSDLELVVFMQKFWIGDQPRPQFLWNFFVVSKSSSIEGKRGFDENVIFLIPADHSLTIL